jgi:hypothetical protein
MPVGNEEKDGYRWNPTVGGWVNIKTGFLKKDEANMNPRAVWLKENHPQDYAAWVSSGSDLNKIPKPSDYSSIVGGFRDVSGAMADPAQYIKDVPVLGKVASFAQELSPTTYVGRMMEAGEQGRYKQAAGQGILALMSAVPFAGKAATAGRLGTGVVGGIARTIGLSPLTRPVSRFIPAVAATLGVNKLFGDYKKPERAQTASSVLPGRPVTPSSSSSYTLTPAQQEAMAKANQNRTDASGSSGMGGGRMFIDWRDWFLSKGQSPEEAARLAKSYVDTGIAWTTEGRAELDAYRNKQTATPATPATPALGLLPLSPDQIDLLGQERLAAEKAYDDLLNEQKMQKSQAQQAYTQQVQGLQRTAAGSAVDLAGQLGQYGIQDSPVSAFGVEQMTQAPLVAGSQAARGTLDQYMADMVAKQKQAKAQKDAAMLDIKKRENQGRIDNTWNQQASAYGNIGGLR